MDIRQPPRAVGSAFDFYRITAKGRRAWAIGTEFRSRHLIDLLDLLRTNGRSMRLTELRQFMPPASLESSMAALLELGLIECVPAVHGTRTHMPLHGAHHAA
jgi:hypothetical protein